MIGDRWRDVEAGRRAGCRTIFLILVTMSNGPIRPLTILPRICRPQWPGFSLRLLTEEDTDDRAGRPESQNLR